MKYTQVMENAQKKLQLNAGIICKTFAPATGEVTGVMFATTGGVNFTAVPTFQDFGDDIDNCPKNMAEMKRLDSVEVKMAGTALTLDPATAKSLAAAADVDSKDATHIIPRGDLKAEDFEDLWWVGDYSDINEDGTTGKAGFCAIHMQKVLNTGGFKLQSGDKAKGQMAFEYTAHYVMSDPTKVPYEMYIKAGA